MPHPLDPLVEAEIRAVTAALDASGHLAPTHRYASIVLDEPPKVDLLAWRDGRAGRPPRRALAVLWDRADGRTHEAVVDLGAADPATGELVGWTLVPGVQPNFTVDEYHECEDAMKADPRVVAALAQRGITDLDLLLVDVWTYGRALMPEQWRERRLGWCDLWLRSSPRGNPYANPVAGLKLVVDMNTMELLEIEQDPDAPPPAPVMGEYEPDLVPGQVLRSDLAPLQVTQPEGVSFTVDGQHLAWQGWEMRVGFTYREGLVLHAVSLGGREVAHRMSFAEMVVPYRDAAREHHRRTAYDIGEWGLGYMTTSLELGCDCLGEIRYLDAVLSDSRGQPYTIRNAICIHEEDGAVLWKHVDEEHGAQVRRMRRFVVSFHATVANYEYIVYWRFHEDGSIESEVRATGIMVTTPLALDAPRPVSGTLVDQRTYAPFHQHFLVARLDLDVDGQANTVLEVDTHAAPVGPDNPHGLALTTTATPVARESESGRDHDWASQRSWKVTNPQRRNAFGDPVAYKLVPSASIPALMDPRAPQFLRAPVIGHQVWVTRHHDDERWPCGAYPTQSETDDGMSRWVADDEDLLETDVVLWYVFGIHHLTRPEDWPVMPADTVSFWLKPFGFFDRNPALDVAPSVAAGCRCAAGACTCDHHGTEGDPR